MKMVFVIRFVRPKVFFLVLILILWSAPLLWYTYFLELLSDPSELGEDGVDEMSRYLQLPI